MLEVISRLHPAAGQQRIGGADNGGVPKSGSDVEIIITFQKGTVNDADNIVPVVVPVFIYKLRCHTLHLIGKSVFTGNVKALFQRRRYHLAMLLPVFPKIRVAKLHRHIPAQLVDRHRIGGTVQKARLHIAGRDMAFDRIPNRRQPI